MGGCPISDLAHTRATRPIASHAMMQARTHTEPTQPSCHGCACRIRCSRALPQISQLSLASVVCYNKPPHLAANITAAMCKQRQPVQQQPTNKSLRRQQEHWHSVVNEPSRAPCCRAHGPLMALHQSNKSSNKQQQNRSSALCLPILPPEDDLQCVSGDKICGSKGCWHCLGAVPSTALLSQAPTT